MECRRCGASLERPGDYCLDCHTANADGVVVALDDERATLTVLDGETVLGTTTVTTTAEPDDRHESTQRRNFVGRVADQVRRKRPEEVYLAGDRETVRALRSRLHYDCYRVPGGAAGDATGDVDREDPVAAAIARRGDAPLAVVEAPAAEKIGGSHSTLIGERRGQRAVHTVAEHPHVKKVVPGPISSGGGSAAGGLRAKVTRADAGGNVRLLLRDGSTVQENRIVTTAPDREAGERVRAALDAALAEAGLSGE